MIQLAKMFVQFFCVMVCIHIASNASAQLFQNNNTSCQDITVLGNEVTPIRSSQSISCGQFDDDSAEGFVDFPDCVSARDAIFEPALAALNPPSNSVLINTRAHGQNCLNAGEANAQFEAPVFLRNINIVPAPGTSRVGTIATGNVDNAGFDDFVQVFVDSTDVGLGFPSLQGLFSEVGGGFGLGGDVASDDVVSLPAGFLPFPVNPREADVVDNTATGHSLIMLDCNADGLDDAAFTAQQDGANQLALMIAQNVGAALNDSVVADNILAPVSAAIFRAPLDAADFDQDGDLDVVVGFSASAGLGSVFATVICLGDGACNFDCPASLAESTVFDINANIGAFPPLAVVAADFDGDSDFDVAWSDANNDRIQYLFSDGTANIANYDSSTFFEFPAVNNDNASQAHVLVAGQFSTTAVQNDIDELAFPIREAAAGGELLSSAFVITTDGSGGLNAPTELNYSQATLGATGADVGDFDHCGGDDIIILNTNANDNTRLASVFLNTNEAPSLTIENPVESLAAVGGNLQLLASCSDPTFDQIDFLWEVVTAPDGATVSFNPASGIIAEGSVDGRADAVFSADTAGSYTIRLTCVDFCGLFVDEEMNVEVDFETQGGCIGSSLNPNASVSHAKALWGLFFLLPLLILFRRLGRKNVLSSFLLVFFFFNGIGISQALDKSFSVNRFEPAFDDTDFFTVYSSPNVLRRNYSAKAYLSYALNPYEIGDRDFGRVDGIVDHLVTAHIAGAYGIFDWFSIGLSVPVFLYEGIDSDILGLNEDNFALGDAKLLAKFQIVDRRRHNIGFSILPFIRFPTSTDSEDFLGYGSFSGGVKLILDFRLAERVSLALNLGYNLRDGVRDIGNNKLDDEISGSLGVSVDIFQKDTGGFKVIGEAEVATVVEDFFSNRRTTPAEARVGFRYTWANNHDINFGAGTALSNGIGNPDLRIFAGYAYNRRPVADIKVPPPEISEITIGDELTIQDKIYFDFDKSSIREISKPTLDKVAGFLRAHPEVTKIKIEGYTCDLGSNAYNLGLSQRRASSVARYLKGQGIDPNRIGTVQGYGETNFLVPNTSESSREQNRRVQIFVQEVR